ncbi:unnamed protein product, partial [Symbiodinium sp. KB8]
LLWHVFRDVRIHFSRILEYTFGSEDRSLTSAQSTLKLSATLTIEKSDDKAKTNEQIGQLLSHAKEQKFEGNVQRFLENMVLDTVVEEKKSTEVPKDFTPPKYRVKAMPKLNAKKITVKKMTAVDLAKRLEEGKDINFKEPMLITNVLDEIGKMPKAEAIQHLVESRADLEEWRDRWDVVELKLFEDSIRDRQPGAVCALQIHHFRVGGGSIHDARPLGFDKWHYTAVRHAHFAWSASNQPRKTVRDL